MNKRKFAFDIETNNQAKKVASMKSTIYVNGISINFADIKYDIEKNNYIGAIRHYRSITGSGLKESKDKIDSFRSGNSFNIIGCTEMFMQFFKDEVEVPDTDVEVLRKALNVMLDNHKILGYNSPIKACMLVLMNYGEKDLKEMQSQQMQPARG